MKLNSKKPSRCLAYLNESDIKPGDVILCYSPEMREARPGRESGYSHAAICCANEIILESAGGGVRLTSLQKLLDEYSHLAIVRNTHAWDADRLAVLNQFALSSVGKKFNLEGLKKYDEQRAESLTSQLERIKTYFDNPKTFSFEPSNELFCSQLVVTAFIVTGIIGASAIPVFSPEIFLPQDLANDGAFGFFIGYLIPYPGYKLAPDDYFKSYAADENFLLEARK